MNPKTYNFRVFIFILIVSTFLYIMIFGYNCSVNYIFGTPTTFFGKLCDIIFTSIMYVFSITSSAYVSKKILNKIYFDGWENFDIYI